MSLFSPPPSSPGTPTPPPTPPEHDLKKGAAAPLPFERRGRNLFEFKNKLHHSVINRIDLELLVKFDSETAHREVSKLVALLIQESNFPLSEAEKQQLLQEVVHETFGLGPLEPLFADSSIDEILVNNYKTVFVERRGKLFMTEVRFKDNIHLRHIINRIVARVGRRIDDSSPMVDARLQDGSRVNAIIPPLSLDGPVLSIRRFKKIPLTPEDLIKTDCVSPEMFYLLQLAVKTRRNIIVSGGTGAGKTTLLNIMSSFIPEDERIITIEDAAELQLQQPHVVRLETRPANMEGKGRISQRELFVNCLRMRPDRIVVGEVRGAEALEMLQAMNTGHDGSITSVHANTVRDALSRIETMVLMGTSNMEQRAIRRQIASAINMVVQIRRFPDGGRRVETISEITGMEGETITMQELACYELKGMTADNNCIGNFKIHPIRPKFIDRAREMGMLKNSTSFETFLQNAAQGKVRDSAA